MAQGRFSLSSGHSQIPSYTSACAGHYHAVQHLPARGSDPPEQPCWRLNHALPPLQQGRTEVANKVPRGKKWKLRLQWEGTWCPRACVVLAGVGRAWGGDLCMLHSLQALHQSWHLLFTFVGKTILCPFSIRSGWIPGQGALLWA